MSQPCLITERPTHHTHTLERTSLLVGWERDWIISSLIQGAGGCSVENGILLGLRLLLVCLCVCVFCVCVCVCVSVDVWKHTPGFVFVFQRQGVCVCVCVSGGTMMCLGSVGDTPACVWVCVWRGGIETRGQSVPQYVD